MPLAVGIHADAYNAPAVAGFDPLTMGWRAAWWANGPEMVALGLADGAAVSSWPDEVGTVDCIQATPANQPVYRTSVALLNGKRAVDAPTTRILVSASTLIQTIPLSVVAVTVLETGASGDRYLCADGVTMRSGNTTVTYNTAVSPAGAFTTEAGHLLIGISTVGPDTATVWLDGTVRATASSSTGASTVVTMFNRAGGGRNYLRPIAFLGLIAGDIRAHASWTDFYNWVKSYYGVVMP